MLSASTDVARARRWSNHLAPSVLSRVGRRKPELADGLSLSPLAVGPTQILMTRRTETHVERARAAEHEFSPHGGRCDLCHLASASPSGVWAVLGDI
jgi:hypothetical protein